MPKADQNIVNIAVNDVVVKYRPREDDGDLSALEESIRRLGLIAPIVIDSENVLIAGGRRLQACKNLGMATIAADRIGVKAGSMKALDIQADENLCRLPLSSEEFERHVRKKKKRAEADERSHKMSDLFAGLKKAFHGGQPDGR